jgi:hypothetical protein
LIAMLRQSWLPPVNRLALVALAVVALGAQTDRAARLHQQAIVVDTHIDTTQLLLRDGWDFMARHATRTAGTRDENASHVD